jgi:hypothetical protein
MWYIYIKNKKVQFIMNLMQQIFLNFFFSENFFVKFIYAKKDYSRFSVLNE